MTAHSQSSAAASHAPFRRTVNNLDHLPVAAPQGLYMSVDRSTRTKCPPWDRLTSPSIAGEVRQVHAGVIRPQ